MGYFPVRYDSRVIIYERKMFIRLATDLFLYAEKCVSRLERNVNSDRQMEGLSANH